VLIFMAGFTNYFSLFSGVIKWILAIILPSLQRLHGSMEKLDICKKAHSRVDGKKMIEGDAKPINVDLEREDECGICLEPCTKMVLPNCCHAMCIKCYHKWYVFTLNIHISHPTKCSNWFIINCDTLMMVFPTCRNKLSESCPFCRGSLRRVNSEDLWVLTCNEDVVDAETVSKEDLLRFNLYISNLPKDHPDALFFMYYEYLIWYMFSYFTVHIGKSGLQLWIESG